MTPAAEERASLAWPLAAIVVLAAAEVLVALDHVLAAQVVDGIMLVVLVNAGQAALRALALVALIRVVGAGLPLGDLSAGAGEALVAVAMVLAVWSAAPAVGVSRRALASLPSVPALAATSLAGLVLGFAAYRLDAPSLASRGDSLGRICLLAAAAAGAALAEELVFRGLVQGTFQRLAGGAGALAVTGLFACTYLSVGPASLVVLVALAGLVFALSVARTGAIGGAAAGHVLFAWGAAVVWPVIFGPAGDAPPDTVTLLVLAVAVLGGAVALVRGRIVLLAGTKPPGAPRQPAPQARMRKTSPSGPR
jgi:membrane protease YdiL (CAAX protease family)